MDDILILIAITVISLFLAVLPLTTFSNHFLLSISSSILLSICIIILPLKIEEHFGYLLFLLVICIAYFHRSSIQKEEYSSREGILHQLLSSAYHKFIPIFGIAIFCIQAIRFVFLSNNSLGSTDSLILLQAFVWLTYNYAGNNFVKEKDFVFLFINFLTFTFALLSFSSLILSGGDGGYNWSFFIHLSLAKPLGILLNILGFFVIVDLDSILYQDTVSGLTTRLWIAKSCSGINSIIIFISAYSSYLLSDSTKPKELWWLIFLGIILSYFANLFRMVVIVIVGHYYGIDYLLWTHENIGWLFFSIWLFIFWQILEKVERYISKVNDEGLSQ